MANQLNYEEPILLNGQQRPTRIKSDDLTLIQHLDSQILFGTEVNDRVEMWVYNPDSSFAGHITMQPSDVPLKLKSVVDQTGAYEFLDIDLVSIFNTMQIVPGKYSIVVNFFRNEIGGEDSYKLYISNISPDRTELQLYPISPNVPVLHDISEFILPSVPREFAQGLLAQLFGVAINTQTAMSITPDKTEQELPPSTDQKLTTASLVPEFDTLVNQTLTLMYPAILDLIAQDITNREIQQFELEAYIESAAESVVATIASSKNYDPRFEIV